MKILILVTKRIQYLIKSKKIIITNSKRRKKKLKNKKWTRKFENRRENFYKYHDKSYTLLHIS